MKRTTKVMESAASAQDSSTSTTRKPYRLGIALSGGGARGFAHAGALMAIEQAGLKPDVVAGVSAGAVIAVLYAAGVKPLRMADIFARTAFQNFVSVSFSGSGLFDMEKFEAFVLRALGGLRRIEDLRIPTYIVATDLDHGRPVAFCEGDIGRIMTASCSIPIVFKPVTINGVSYVDGGVLRNQPAWVLRDKCDTLIGINVSPLRPAVSFRSVLSVALRTYSLMTRANTVDDMALCDIPVAMPEVANYGVFDLRRIKELFVQGYVSTRNALREAGLWNPDVARPDPKLSTCKHNNTENQA